ncbi:MAG TPA: nickel pincer cofactor biosynthesis protein LarC [Patescibacteria group bacterium]|nr:nickel pincer cofactor biosynthesis protein LarC [Patescibacteria group bacterium]
MTAVYLECFAGASGNMLLGALLDAGVPETVLREQLACLPVDGYRLITERVDKCGITAVYVDVVVESDQDHRHLADILSIIQQSSLPTRVKERSSQVFQRLAAAEAKVHGVDVEEIHFHEVGAVDAIVDIVGTMIGLEYLQVDRLYVSKMRTGQGFVKCCHGVMPVPAPATAELLCGLPYYQGDIEKELLTPTGAAILATLGDGFGEKPQDFITEIMGYGAGGWDLTIPNVLRLHRGRLETETGVAKPLRDPEQVILIETNIDDQNPQIFPYVMDRLLATGALDVWLTPIIMKKGRPAHVLSILCHEQERETLTELILVETTTIGIRYSPVTRTIAERAISQVETRWGMVRVKISRHQDQIVNIMPEYEDCRRLAEAFGVALKDVQQAALAAAYTQR